ncbi:MAG: DUF433 domain-containing protein [Gammaproteobacteria bacterium]
MINFPERISIDPKVCFGKPCIRGTRIWLSLLLDCGIKSNTWFELSRQMSSCYFAYGKKLTIRELSFVVLIGVSGSGKRTFKRKHCKPTETLSSDCGRGLVPDDENNHAATKDALKSFTSSVASGSRREKLAGSQAPAWEPGAGSSSFPSSSPHMELGSA